MHAQVGGDGLFQEVLNGLLALRREGGPRAVVAEGLRLAQIPAGSTDAVACTLNGSRSVEAAALHVALGDGCASLGFRVYQPELVRGGRGSACGPSETGAPAANPKLHTPKPKSRPTLLSYQAYLYEAITCRQLDASLADMSTRDLDASSGGKSTLILMPHWAFSVQDPDDTG